MYPPHPWKEIGSLAVDLIGNLLQVSKKKSPLSFLEESTLSRLTLFYTGVGLKNPWLNTTTKAKLLLEATFLIIILTYLIL